MAAREERPEARQGEEIYKAYRMRQWEGDLLDQMPLTCVLEGGGRASFARERHPRQSDQQVHGLCRTRNRRGALLPLSSLPSPAEMKEEGPEARIMVHPSAHPTGSPVEPGPQQVLNQRKAIYQPDAGLQFATVPV
ncbi:uncharacterized protein LOC121019961 isoform X2 [Herpailurus yagouaroundi]|uniref:uncharacterized protein LOC121019961 isoform X2 n=1 Tax=Herpailurus yagouaroundi TaxID=1608482 RepID=UPI001AD72661|nr:uncharacterized protein LOC121019961 isoform X2 [Puma yagouaroundi]